jgi:thiol:disulfide interchange protein DsbD
VSEQFTLAERLSADNLAISLSVLLLLGIGLAFTPCVYPMYPILSTIVMGKNKNEMKLSQAFLLSFVYVQGMAITYSILGLIVASAGVQFQAALQNPILLGIFIILFIALALAMFGLYEIQLPSKWQEKLNGLSNNQKSGNLVGVFMMGVISGLVASPCTTAPLTAILLVVAQSESIVFGFSALYALSLGMGIPLILFGMTGGKLLPKAGSWMNVIKATFGFMMLTVAILFVERIFVAAWTELLWAALGLSLFAYLFTVNQDSKTSFAKGVRSLVVMTGFVASVLYSVNALQMNGFLSGFGLSGGQSTQVAKSNMNAKGHPEFTMIRDLEDFDKKLAAANAQGKSVMVDLYADWCVACKEFEKYTFPDPEVISALGNTEWMQIDLTDNTPVNLAFQDEFQVLGLPTILFFNAQGEEVKQSRVTGFMKADAFAEHVNQSLNN